MVEMVEALQSGQTLLGMAHNWFGEEFVQYGTESNSGRVIVGVIDTNILLGDVRHSLRVKRLTSLMEAARIGALKLFASMTVRDEVWEKLGDEKITKKLKIDSQEACQRWEQDYLPWITFLDPAGLPPLTACPNNLLQ